MAVIDAVAATLLAHPQIKKVEVQGHTDADGNDASNLQLSQDRVDTVVDLLIDMGVEADRLIPKGYGETLPIADNNTAAGREQNRRVEFVILVQE